MTVASVDPVLIEEASAGAQELGLRCSLWQPSAAPERDAVVVVDARGDLDPLEAIIRSLGPPRRLATVVLAVVGGEDAPSALDADADDLLIWPSTRAAWVARLRVSALRAERRISMDPRLAVALAHVGESVELTDRDGFIEYVNPAFEEMFGYTSDEAVGLTPAELLRSGFHDDAFYEHAWNEVSSGRVWRGMLVSRRRDGGLVHCDTTCSPLFDAAGEVNGLVVIRRDSTAQRELRLRLERSERLSALGTLAAGISHEINNPLAFVLANVEHALDLCDESQDAPPGLRASLGDALTGAERVRGIVGHMSLLAHQREAEPRPVDLAQVLRSAVEIGGVHVRRVAEVKVHIEGEPRALGHESELGRIALNLLVNAAHAIERDDDASAHTVWVRAGIISDAEVYFEVQDDGIGMDEETRRRAFDPFFTTKASGVGTGLGLSLSHRIVQSLGGRMSIRSRPGEGTAVRVVLPRSTTGDIPKSTVPPAGSASDSASDPALRILVVDDEPAMGTALRRVFRGHEVEVHTDGLAALAQLESQDFDVVVCDLSMPVLGGRELREALPDDMPIRDRWLYLTGGVLNEQDREYLERFAGPVVHKPFRARTLRSIVRTLCRRAGALPSGSASEP